jgi:protein-disulfide isomerase
VVWTDYQCPACKQFERELDSVRDSLSDSLIVFYHQFPLTNAHPLALAAAEGAVCAAQQGRFSELHHALFAASLRGDSIAWQPLVAQAGIIDTALFEQCIRSPATKAQVETERQSGIDLRLGGTPGLLIAQHLQVGGTTAAELIRRLRKARSAIATRLRQARH